MNTYPARDRRPRADAVRNREALLAAARAAFAAEGESARLEHIARSAGVGIGTLYRHFATREDLVQAVYRSELDELCASPSALLAELAPPDALRAWMDRFGASAAVKREIADALPPAYVSAAVSVSAARQQLASAVEEVLRAGAAEGTFRSDVRASDLVVAIVGAITATRIASDENQLERIFDLLAAAVRQ